MLKYLLKSAFRAIEASYNTPERKGARGEKQVHSALGAVLPAKDYFPITDCTFSTARGTTQIDHIVLSRYGIFVIETKNMSGWIFGGQDQSKWTQVQRGGSKRGFQNPLRQNYAHIKAVEGMLSVDGDKLHNFVVFTGSAIPKTEMPENVAWGLKDLGAMIARKREIILSDQQVQQFRAKLLRLSLENTKTVRQEHIANLELRAAKKKLSHTNNHASVPSVAVRCPRCGAPMHERENRKTSQKFWGCSDFPKCRGTRKSV